MNARTPAPDISRDAFAGALRRRDAVGACTVYSDDARLLPPDTQAVIGRDHITGFWQAGIDSGIADLVYEPSDVLESDVVVCELGLYTLRFAAPEGETVAERGRYVHIHERQADGRWLRTVDLFTPGADE